MTLIGLVVLLILNPYTIIGPVGYYAALPIAGLAITRGMKSFENKVFYCFCIFVFISLIGVASSILHGITQFEHLKVAISVFIYYLTGIGIFVAYKKRLDINDLLLFSLIAGTLNSAVILLQVQFPQFRALVESVFVESGNIDWTEGFRYRGLASGGGASLSVLSAFMVYISLYLYSAKKINIVATGLSLIILIFSVFFIGRTGVLLIAAAFLFYALTQGWKNIKAIAFIVFVVLFIFLIGLDYIKEFLIQEYGEGFYTYSLGFLLDGKQGFEDEGTVGIIAEFLTVVPKQFPELLIGYGFYGGSDFSPWSDSGYARMFLSVGFLWGLVFYTCAFYVFIKSASGKKALFLPFVGLLAIAETKESMMFAGYSSRLFFILLGFWAAQRIHAQRQATQVALNTTA